MCWRNRLIQWLKSDVETLSTAARRIVFPVCCSLADSEQVHVPGSHGSWRGSNGGNSLCLYKYRNV